MSDCIFCRIRDGQLPSRKVYEDDLALAFHDIHPQAPVHLLVIPKRHVANLAEVTAEDRELLGHLQWVIRRVAEEAGIAGGFRVVANNGPGANQLVPHLHYHVLGGRDFTWPPG